MGIGMTPEDYLIRTRVSEILIECRKEKGITQAELAKAMGTTPTTVATWEQNKSMPSIQMLYRLAKYYGKSISYMYGEEAVDDEKPFIVVYQGGKKQYSKEELELVRDVFKHGTLPWIQADSDSVIRNSGPTSGDAGDKGEGGQN